MNAILHMEFEHFEKVQLPIPKTCVWTPWFRLHRDQARPIVMVSNGTFFNTIKPLYNRTLTALLLLHSGPITLKLFQNYLIFRASNLKLKKEALKCFLFQLSFELNRILKDRPVCGFAKLLFAAS